MLDTLIRSRGGANECVGNPNVIRGDFIEDNDPDSDTYNAMDMNDYAYVISERIDTTPSELSYALELANQAIELDPKTL